MKQKLFASGWKRVIITLIILVVSMPAYTDDWKPVCDSFDTLSGTIMNNRQSGVSMSKMMATIGKMKDAKIREVSEKLTISAYSKPRYSTEKMQKRAVSEFRNSTYLSCVKLMRSKSDKQ